MSLFKTLSRKAKRQKFMVEHADLIAEISRLDSHVSRLESEIIKLGNFTNRMADSVIQGGTR